jgi:hypothetical protein
MYYYSHEISHEWLATPSSRTDLVKFLCQHFPVTARMKLHPSPHHKHVVFILYTRPTTVPLVTPFSQTYRISSRS